MSGSSLIGQHQALELLQQAIKAQSIAPAYLFVGPEGIGRSLIAKSFSTQILTQGLPPEAETQVRKRLEEGNHPDVLMVQPTYQHQGQLLTASEAEASGVKRKAPPQIRIEQIRDITRFLSRPPLEAERSVVIICEAQTMTEAAANGLLKTLEKPGRATLILIAPTSEALLSTLVSRCQKIPFSRLTPEQMRQVLEQTGHAQINSLPELLAIAQGSPGEAIAAYQLLESIPLELRSALTHLPPQPLQLLELAKRVSQELDAEAQLWLVDYLQYHYWHTSQDRRVLEYLEKTKSSLLSYVQARLVWEWTLLSLVQILLRQR
jgi:DNA polymerase-3 subunit delta'